MVHPEIDVLFNLHLAAVLRGELPAHFLIQAFMFERSIRACEDRLRDEQHRHLEAPERRGQHHRPAQSAGVLRIPTLPPVRHDLRKPPAAGHPNVVPAGTGRDALQMVFVEFGRRATEASDHALRNRVQQHRQY